MGRSAAGGGRARSCALAADAPDARAEAAERYAATTDPLSAARAYAAAARLRVRAGLRAAGDHTRAAQILVELGAHRSLVELLRDHPGTSALAPFAPPEAWRRGRIGGLTPRERTVADLARQGYTAREIGELLGISHRTAQVHLDALRRKLGVARKSDLVRAFAPEHLDAPLAPLEG